MGVGGLQMPAGRPPTRGCQLADGLFRSRADGRTAAGASLSEALAPEVARAQELKWKRLSIRETSDCQPS